MCSLSTKLMKNKEIKGDRKARLLMMCVFSAYCMAVIQKKKLIPISKMPIQMDGSHASADTGISWPVTAKMTHRITKLMEKFKKSCNDLSSRLFNCNNQYAAHAMELIKARKIPSASGSNPVVDSF